MSLLKKILNRNKESANNNIKKYGYQTILDRIYNLVQATGSISLGNVSKVMGVSIQEVEKHSKILSKDGLIEVIYPVVGTPELRLKGFIKKHKVHAEVNHVKGGSRRLSIVVTSILLVSASFLFFLGSNQSGLISVNNPLINNPVILSPSENSLENVLSGEGNYSCDFQKSGFDGKYYVSGDKIRVELLDSDGKSVEVYVLKDGNVFSYSDKDNDWDEIEDPLWSISPSLSVNCEETDVNQIKFNVSE